jgi:hypothetical protein
LTVIAGYSLLAGCREPVRIEPVATLITEEDLTGLWMEDDGTEGWAVGAAGTVLRLESGRWAEVNSLRWRNTGRFNDLAVSPGGVGLAVGTDGVVARLAEEEWSIDVQLGKFDDVVQHFTERWERRSGRRASSLDAFRLALPLAELTPFMALEAVWADERADTAWFAAGSGGLLHYVRDVEVRSYKAPGLTVNDLWLDRDGMHGWAVGAFRPETSPSGGGHNQIAFARYGHERGWELLTPDGRPGSGTAIAMTADGREGWAVADEGSVFHFDGKRWEHARSVSEPLNAVWAHPGHTEAWAAGAKGTVFLIWGGPPYISFAYPGAGESLNAIWLDPEGSAGWTVGDAGTILRITVHTPDAKQ